MRGAIATLVKSNANYTCQQCEGTELVQAYHKVPKDDSSLVALCAECHSREHPDVPEALFFVVKVQQPYWWNRSASTIARGLFVHPRTVIWAARRLGIDRGVLSLQDELRLELSIYPAVEVLDVSVDPSLFTKLYIHRCLRCNNDWSSESQHPKRCGKCKSPYWDRGKAKR